MCPQLVINALAGSGVGRILRNYKGHEWLVGKVGAEEHWQTSCILTGPIMVMQLQRWEEWGCALWETWSFIIEVDKTVLPKWSHSESHAHMRLGGENTRISGACWTMATFRSTLALCQKTQPTHSLETVFLKIVHWVRFNFCNDLLVWQPQHGQQK